MEYFVPKKVSFQNNLDRNLQTPLIIFLLDVNFENLTVGLYVLIISSIIVKFQKNQRSIVMLLIKCLNFNFL